MSICVYISLYGTHYNDIWGKKDVWSVFLS